MNESPPHIISPFTGTRFEWEARPAVFPQKLGGLDAIVKAFAELQFAMLNAGLKPLTALVLADHEELMRLMSLDQRGTLLHPQGVERHPSLFNTKLMVGPVVPEPISS
jgi:hypothetical protein